MSREQRRLKRAARPEGYTDQHPPLPRAPLPNTRQRRERDEKRRLFGRTIHTSRSWQEFCRVLRNGNTTLSYPQLVKLSRRLSGRNNRRTK
jgi:hypothetical protein